MLQDAFLASKTTPLGLVIINALLYIYKSDPANYFIVESYHTLSAFIEMMFHLHADVQSGVFKLVEYVIVEQRYIPTAELTSIGLLLSNTE